MIPAPALLWKQKLLSTGLDPDKTMIDLKRALTACTKTAQFTVNAALLTSPCECFQGFTSAMIKAPPRNRSSFGASSTEWLRLAAHPATVRRACVTAVI